MAGNKSPAVVATNSTVGSYLRSNVALERLEVGEVDNT